jgi:hypothetical protein
MHKRLISLLALTLGAVIAAALLALPTGFAANSAVNRQSAATPEPLVGFWYIKLTAEGNASGPPDGTVVDWGLQQFHSDGTEILNSGSGPKRFCLGIWVKESGPPTYELNHFPLDFPDGTTLHIINLREKFTLSRNHNSMAGTFTFDVYDAGGNLLAHIAGDVAGHRITIGSSVQDVLPPTP